jgi:Acetyltransferase (GNAT) domain
MSFRLEEVSQKDVPWHELERYADRTLFQSAAWLSYLAEAQGAKPVFLRIAIGQETMGYFTGAIVSKLGLRILGSPFKGWGTPYMGFNAAPDVDRGALVEALAKFTFRELRCHHLELIDGATKTDGAGDGTSTFDTMEIDLTRSCDELLKNMALNYRRNIRTAARNGVLIEQASAEGFAREYYDQLVDVFAKQGGVPPFGVGRVEALIRHVYPTGNLLLLRAKSRDAVPIATGIFPGFGGTAYFWGGASWRKTQYLRPNEALMWRAMCYWKQRGAQIFDMGGLGGYKLKYGSRIVHYPRVMRSCSIFLPALRHIAERTWQLRCDLIGRLQRLEAG